MKENFKALLRQVGSRATPKRLALLRLLERTKRPMSPQTISEVLHEADLATVYRILKFLKEKGVIRQVDFEHGHVHYELAREDDHHHLVCTKCGRMEDVEICEVDDMSRNIIRRSKCFVVITRHALEFYGLCRKCAKQ